LGATAGAAGAQSGFKSLTCPDRIRNLHLQVLLRLLLNLEGSRIRLAGPVC
jgi:hypothetical protein